MSIPKHLLEAKICNKENCSYIKKAKKDLKERNDKLKKQLELEKIRCFNLEYKVERLEEKIDKAIIHLANCDWNDKDFAILYDILEGDKVSIEEIDKWLNNEYGVSYSKLDELNSFYFERYIEQKEEIKRLNNIINEVKELLENPYNQDCVVQNKEILDKINELEEK